MRSSLWLLIVLAVQYAIFPASTQKRINADIILLVEDSESLGAADFGRSIASIEKLRENDGLAFAVIRFSKSAQVIQPLVQGNERFKESIKLLQMRRSSQPVDVGLALSKVVQSILASDPRKNVHNLIVAITSGCTMADGQANDAIMQRVIKAKKQLVKAGASIKMVIVGDGSKCPKHQQFAEKLTDPVDQWPIDRFDDFVKMLEGTYVGDSQCEKICIFEKAFCVGQWETSNGCQEPPTKPICIHSDCDEQCESFGGKGCDGVCGTSGKTKQCQACRQCPTTTPPPGGLAGNNINKGGQATDDGMPPALKWTLVGLAAVVGVMVLVAVITAVVVSKRRHSRRKRDALEKGPATPTARLYHRDAKKPSLAGAHSRTTTTSVTTTEAQIAKHRVDRTKRKRRPKPKAPSQNQLDTKAVAPSQKNAQIPKAVRIAKAATAPQQPKPELMANQAELQKPRYLEFGNTKLESGKK